MAFQNFYSSKISNDIGAGDVTITVDNAPTSTSGRMTLEARNATQREIIKYTGVAGNVLTGVTRGQGGTTAKSHIKGALIQQNATGEDLQDLYDAFASFAASTNSWLTAVNLPNTITNNNQRSYDLTYTGVNLTSLYSKGMRLKLTRNTPSPNQCANLNGTNQSFSRVSGSLTGFTPTDDITFGMWIKPTAYGVSVNQGLMTRQNGTSGFEVRLESNTGRLQAGGYNASLANYSFVTADKSVPLNRWTYVAGCLDMSAFTNTPTTSWITYDGIDVASACTRGGTNPTAFIQVGNFEIGSSAGSAFYSGKIAQAILINTKATQATMAGYMNQGITGSETGAIVALSLSNSLNDLTANANHLTANNGVTTTTADAPFGTQGNGEISTTVDYGIIMNVVYSGGNTVITVSAPEGCTIPTTGTISAMAYSYAKNPYNFPAQKGKWRIVNLYKAQKNIPITAVTNWSAGTAPNVLTVPAGAWNYGVDGVLSMVSTVSGARNAQVAISNAQPPSNTYGVAPGARIYNQSNPFADWSGRSEAYVELSAASVYNAYTYLYTASGSESWVISGLTETVFFAENALL